MKNYQKLLLQNFALATAGIFLTIVVSSGVLAQGELNIRDCARIGSAQERLNCYDRAQPVDTTPLQQLPEQSVLTPRPRLTESAPIVAIPETISETTEIEANNSDGGNRVANFGLERTTQIESRIGVNEDGKAEFFDTIIALKKRGDGMWVVTLASGQIWLQQLGSSRYNLKVGQDIKIYPTMWGGGYRLTALNLKSYIQVKRVK